MCQGCIVSILCQISYPTILKKKSTQLVQWQRTPIHTQVCSKCSVGVVGIKMYLCWCYRVVMCHIWYVRKKQNFLLGRELLENFERVEGYPVQVTFSGGRRHPVQVTLSGGGECSVQVTLPRGRRYHMQAACLRGVRTLSEASCLVGKGYPVHDTLLGGGGYPVHGRDVGPWTNHPSLHSC